MPHLDDPNFARAVVLMIDHDDEGSFGLIINRPTELKVASLLEDLELPWRGHPDVAAWAGGPVMPTSGWVLHETSASAEQSPATRRRGLEEGETVSVAPGVALSSSPEALALIAEDPPERTKFLLGYSGWGPGQLADEVARGAWLHADARPELLFDTPADEIWAGAVASLGIHPESIVPAQGIH